jgi:hypothetical protein
MESSAKVGDAPEKVQSDTQLGPTDDQEIVDVILSGRVSTASLLLRPRFSFLPLLTRPLPF